MRSILFITVTAALFLLAGCHPYFNTFYNAEEAFTAAQRDHAKFMRRFPDSLVVTPPASAVGGYDRAIEKSLKMMEVYPREVKRQDRAHYLMGRSSFYKMDFPVAIGRMRDMQTAFPESPLVPFSQIYVAKSHIMMDNLAVAEEILLELLNTHPHLDKNHEITMLLVEIALRRGARSQALELLERVGRGTLSLERRINVILRMADLNFDLRQFQTALNLLNSVPRSRKLSYLMYRTDRSIYFCHDAMDSHEAALAHLITMRRNRRYANHRYEIMYYQAMTLRRMGRVDEAMALLYEIRRMCERGASGGAAGGAVLSSNLCGQAAYALGLIYQERGQFDRAEEAFAAAAGLEGSSASARLWALKRLKELRTPDDSGQISPESRYMIAELFYFELETPDSAFVYFLELASAPDAESMRPRSLLAAAVTARHRLGDIPTSDSLLNIILDEFQDTEYARRVQIELDVEITVVTARDRAERAFRAAEALVANSPVDAVKAFYDIHLEFPDLPIAARGLHAAAWVTDNVLQRNRAAITLYEELCEKYSESEYCLRSAAPRVSIARDSMEVRRQRREAAQAAADSAAIGDSVSIGVDIDADSTSAGGTVDDNLIDLDDGDTDTVGTVDTAGNADDVDDGTVADTEADTPPDDVNTDTGVDTGTDAADGGP
ncbi:MAG: hypothetical protein LBC70_01620 [Chitinispirillales bacterium]|jgi:tetratricopeptide (TPR) repeat protein|nr:hypothetical protein [Chitinispirillales bacterium]